MLKMLKNMPYVTQKEMNIIFTVKEISYWQIFPKFRSNSSARAQLHHSFEREWLGKGLTDHRDFDM